ncbi:MAG TPA: alanine racemase, partial [Rhodothermales bacterium]|nr:alanine racemase [Rhodothermales bacterium]
MSKLRYERPIIRMLNSTITQKFGSSPGFKPFTHIDGMSVKELIADYGSPLFVVSERTLRQTYKAAYRAFSTRYPKVQFAWSYKTNYLGAVCQIFHQEGSWAEVVSRFEFEKALRNGVAGNKIIFNGPEKTEDDLRTAVQYGALIHIDHFDELNMLSMVAVELGVKPKVAIRVNMDTGVYPIWDRFGFNYESGQAMEAIQKIMTDGFLELVGLHCHIGTFMLSADAYRIATEKLSKLALHIAEHFGHSLSYLDLGGGFATKNTLRGAYLNGADAAPSFHDYAEAITDVLLNAGFQAGQLPTLILETGRALVDDAGYLLGSVIANKRLSDGRRATILDFGVNILFTAFWYEHTISTAQACGQYGED